MREHYGLDRLVDYAIEDIPDTTKVVNPAYRRLDGRVRSLRGHLTGKLAAFSAMDLKGEYSIGWHEANRWRLYFQPL